jgi:diguanylate cyclase (GGDEF)-like protein
MPRRDEPARALRALAVDDDALLRTMAKRCLAGMGFAVTEFANAEEAIASTEQEVPDLVLLDVQMDGLDGFAACREFRRLHPEREIAILIMTGQTDHASIDEAFEAGASDFVGKPIDWGLLRHRVRFLMRAHHAFAEHRAALSRLRESEQGLARAQRIAGLGSWQWAPGESEMLWSAETHRLLGIAPAPGASTLAAFLEAVHADDRPAVEKALLAASAEARGFGLDHRVVTPAGEEIVVHQEAEIAASASGETILVSGTLQNVTALRRAEAKIHHLVSYDALTGLPNRRLLVEHLERAIGHAQRREGKVALLLLDIDRFKRVNDSLGHSVGDGCLRQIAGRLVGVTRATDAVARPSGPAPIAARLGGDEFAVVVRDIRSERDVSTIARRLLEAIRRPTQAGVEEIALSASIGIAQFPEDGGDAESLLQHADAAIDYAKERGGNAFRFFREAMNDVTRRSMLLENHLRLAIERGELALVYQPLVSTEDERIVGAEALCRWTSETLGPISPVEFIPLAEETGLIVALGEWALRQACRDLRRWREAGAPELSVSVNVSAIHIQEPDFVARVDAILREEGIAPQAIELELTESVFVGSARGVIQVIEELRGRGLRIALDDFGTGYSSLAQLTTLPIDDLKIDRSFVSRLGAQREVETLVAAVVAVSHQLGMRVTAEGVETAEQEAVLRALACDQLQGYRIARPMGAAALLEFVRRYGAARD